MRYLFFSPLFFLGIFSSFLMVLHGSTLEDYRNTTVELQGEVLAWTLYQRNMSPANNPRSIYTTNEFQGSKIDSADFSGAQVID